MCDGVWNWIDRLLIWDCVAKAISRRNSSDFFLHSIPDQDAIERDIESKKKKRKKERTESISHMICTE